MRRPRSWLQLRETSLHFDRLRHHELEAALKDSREDQAPSEVVQARMLHRGLHRDQVRIAATGWAK